MTTAQQISAAKKQAKAITQQGALKAERKKVETFSRAGQQKASFLASGITLEGTPLAVLESTFETGKQDVQAIRKSANVQSRNIMNKAYSDALTNILTTAATSGFGGGGAENMMGQQSLTGATGMAMQTDPSTQLFKPQRKPIF
jgi:hypothetical protein